MELIISDNANTDETQEVIKSFSVDKRLKVLRLEKPVNVTDNWSNALKASSGEYFLMMGDDDCLLPGYFHRMDDILKKYNNPDCVTYNAYTYVAPDSINGNAQSYYNKVHFRFGDDFKEEGLIPPKMRFSIVKDMYRFRVRIPLNMQTTLVSRKAANRITGGIFHPPFPDHYALNALLLNTERWVYIPENLLIVGVSSKSFGHFVYSNQQEKGLNYLGIGADFQGRLPGNELINYMHVWLDLLKKNYSDRLNGVKISRSNYVRRQLYHWYIQYKSKGISLNELKKRQRLLSPVDSLGLFLFIFDRESWVRLWRMLVSGKHNKLHKGWYGLMPVEHVLTIKDFRTWVSKKVISKSDDC
jgi:glycosyltransferase involved in cell wall biosynthesis